MEEEIIKKMKERKLSYNEIEYIVKGYIKNLITDEEMTLFLKNIYNNGLSIEETIYLTDIMIKSGKQIDLSKVKAKTIDKHSTGGVGDKVTLIISPIVASLGIIVPKMSGRSLGLTGGTIDKLESIKGYNVNLTDKEFIDELNKIGMSVISSSKELCIADKKIYALRDEKGLVDSTALIASSIMSKKIASGSDNIVIDLKVGTGAFMKDKKSATELAKTMIKIGAYYNKKVICLLSDMNYPLGRTVGNILEVKEAKEFFDGICDKRLKELCIYISSYMIMISKNITLKEAKNQVEKVLSNGKAKDKFYEWITYQGGQIDKIEINSQKIFIKSTKSGYINNVKTISIASLVKELGAGRVKKEDKIDYEVGIEFNKVIGDKVKKGDILGTIYFNKEVKNMERKFRNSIIIEEKKKKIPNIIIDVIK